MKAELQRFYTSGFVLILGERYQCMWTQLPKAVFTCKNLQKFCVFPTVWWMVAVGYSLLQRSYCTKYLLVIILVTRRLQRLLVGCMEGDNLFANTCILTVSLCRQVVPGVNQHKLPNWLLKSHSSDGCPRLDSRPV